MATTKTEAKKQNILQKLNAARVDFLAANVSKSGINDASEYDYFELKDIVPVATPILQKHGLIFVITFPDGVPKGVLFDEDGSDTLTFFSPKIDGPILSPKGAQIMTDIQSEGAKQTYHRRYLWMQVLDIAENDGVDCKFVDVPPEPKRSDSKPPSPSERDAIKEELSGADNKADELQIDALKAALKKLNSLDSTRKDFINELMIKTEGFTTLTREKADELIIKVNDICEEIEAKK